ncbi:MAG TPA: TIGR03790 family protein, partial [Roseateles sp.]|nr:TIGR03790 family protein [Roseateles sp.]
DHSLTLRGTPPAQAVFASTADRARNVRAPLFPPEVRLWAYGLQTRRVMQEALPELDAVLIYQTGLARVAGLERIPFLPGALADHLTSAGGQLERTDGPQMSALDWIEAGATASHGAVSEPCNHLQKFPHPQLLLLNYLQGASALEAYWRSVLWPGQSVFVGEPLAAPYAREPLNP